jgi:hypothetical protein
MLRYVAHVRTDISEERITSIFRVTRIDGLVFHRSVRRLLAATNAVPISPILVTLMMQAIPKRRFLQGPHGITSQKTTFFIVTASEP